MLQAWVIWFLTVIIIRALAGYDSRFQKRGYTVKSKALKFFIDEDLFFEKKKRPKKDRNKISLTGLIFYVASGIVAIINIVLALLPNIPIKPIDFEIDESVIRISTFNQKFSFQSVIWLMCAVLIYIGVWLLRTAQFEKQKWMRVLTRATAVVLMLICVAGVFII